MDRLRRLRNIPIAHSPASIVQRDHPACLRAAVLRGYRPTNALLADAAAGHLDCLDMLLRNGMRPTAEAQAAAAAGGHIRCLARLYAAGGMPAADETVAAASGGLRVLRLARAQGALWHEDTAAAIATHGSTGAMAYAIENGAPCLFQACMGAAEAGRPDTLRVLIDAGTCLRPGPIAIEAARSGSADCLALLITRFGLPVLLRNDCDCPGLGCPRCDLALAAVQEDAVDCLNVLLLRGGSVQHALLEANRCGSRRCAALIRKAAVGDIVRQSSADDYLALRA